MLKKVLKGLILLVVCILIELLVFNYSGLRTFFMDNKNIEVEYKILDLVGNEYDKLGDVANIITIDEINIPVSAINIYYEENAGYNLNYILQFSSYSSRYNHNNYIEKIMNTNDKNYINFYTNSECEHITITLQSEEDIDLKINKIILNKININFSFVRIFVMFVICGIAIYFKKSKKLYLNCTKKSILYITILAIIIFNAIYLILMDEFTLKHQIQLLIIYICFILIKIIYDEILKYFKLENISVVVYHIAYLLIVISSNILYLFSGQILQIYILIVICLLLSIFICTFKLLNKGKQIWIYTIISTVLFSIIIYLNYVVAIFVLPCLLYMFFRCIEYGYKIRIKIIVLALCIMFIIVAICFAQFKLACNYEYENYKFSGLQTFRNMLEYISNSPDFELNTYPVSNINKTNQEIYTSEQIKGENIFALGIIYVPLFYILLIYNNLFKDEKEVKRVYNLYVVLSIIFILILSCNNVITEDYSIIVKLILSVLSSLVFIKLIKRYDNNKSIIYILLGLLIVTLLIVYPISLSTNNLYLLDNEKELNMFLRNVFLFWQ